MLTFRVFFFFVACCTVRLLVNWSCWKLIWSVLKSVPSKAKRKLFVRTRMFFPLLWFLMVVVVFLGQLNWHPSHNSSAGSNSMLISLGKSWSLKKSCASSVTTWSPWKSLKKRYTLRLVVVMGVYYLGPLVDYNCREALIERCSFIRY